ncbi:MAG: alpha-E domain-containing protein [Thiothrix sp.]|nr:MAG: alpha-E domain-containing protein [Thiothrix sp.]
MMLSRVAERVYWMARYLERADNTARLISAHTVLLMDLPETLEFNWFTPVVIFNAEAQYKKSYPEVSEENVMRFLIADRDNPSSLLGSFANVRENVRTSLDLLPEEIWEQVNQTYMQLQAALSSLGSRHSRQMVLRDVMAACQRIRGVLESHLSRDHAFDFIQIGKHVERADMTSRTLEMTSLLLAEDRSHALRRYESILWSSLLSALGGQQMYLRHKNSRVVARDVLQFLCQDLQFPRSLLYSLTGLNFYLARLPEPSSVSVISAKVAEQFAKQDITAIPVDQIHWFMDRLQADLTVLHNEIAKTWFYPETDFSQLQSQSQG